MKTVIPLLALVLMAAGCMNSQSSSSAEPVKSERDYAIRQEAIAQDLFKTGQASSIQDARAQAGLQMNNEWATAAKAAEGRQKQAKFEQDLAKMAQAGK